jgi:membrane fusion protein, heavy metal efflux system
MKLVSGKLLRRSLLWVGILLLLGVSLAAVPFVKQWATAKSADADPTDATFLQVVQRNPWTVRVDPATVRSLAMQTAEVQAAGDIRPLRMVGQLAIDTDHLIRIKPFFAGKIAEIGPVKPGPKPGQTLSNIPSRPLHSGDPVEPNQLLATYWSKDLGQAKSTLVATWATLLADQKYLSQLRQYPTAVQAKLIWDTERQVDADRIAVNAAERQLRAWGIPSEEIDALKKEGKAGGTTDKDQWQKWATYEIRAPKAFPGIIVEQNGTIGENIDPSSGPPLFQIADFRRMVVYAYPYEEDLPALEKLRDRLKKQGKDLTWTITLKADPKRKLPPGKVDKILPILDPNQKTPILRGYIDDPDGNLNPRLLATMSVVAEIKMPPPPGEVMVPATALVDDGQQSIVFVQTDPNKADEFTLVPVDVVRRYADRVYIRVHSPTIGKEPAALELKPGQRVLVSGAVELKAAVDDLPPEPVKDKSSERGG